MEFLEYPKALYLAGQQMVVEDSAQEEAARADGYDDWHADHERAEGADEAEEAEEKPLDRDALKAEAKALGIEFPRNVSNEKLAELIAATKA